MQGSRRTTLWVGLFTVALILLTQYLSWRDSGRLNAGLFAALALVLGPLIVAMRRRPPDDQGRPRS